MLRPTIATGTGAQCTQQIDLGEDIEMITRTHRGRFHEILTGVTREPGTHEDIQNVMNVRLRLAQRDILE